MGRKNWTETATTTETTTMMRALLLLCFIAAIEAKILEPRPFKRLIPADTLRDFPGMCFASTQCKVYPPDETWSLEPFCGQSTCRAMKNPDAKIKLLEVVLAEEVVDCGPLIDLKKSTGCKLAEDTAEEEKEEKEPKASPECCPKYDCEEEAEIFYVGAGPAGKEGGVEAAVAAAVEVEKELADAGIASKDA